MHIPICASNGLGSVVFNVLIGQRVLDEFDRRRWIRLIGESIVCDEAYIGHSSVAFSIVQVQRQKPFSSDKATSGGKRALDAE